MTDGQQRLKKAHGTPGEFRKAVLMLVPGWISMSEADTATDAYLSEWNSHGNCQSCGDSGSVLIRDEGGNPMWWPCSCPVAELSGISG